MPPPQYRKREPFLEPDQPYILISNSCPSWLWGITAYCFSNMVGGVLLWWPELTDKSFYTFSSIICNKGGQVYTIISTVIYLHFCSSRKSLRMNWGLCFSCFYFLGCIQVSNEDPFQSHALSSWNSPERLQIASNIPDFHLDLPFQP